MAGPRIILDEELARTIVAYWRKAGYQGIQADVQEGNETLYDYKYTYRRIVSNIDGRGFPPKQ